MNTLKTLLFDASNGFLVQARHLLRSIKEIAVIGCRHDDDGTARLAELLKPELILIDMSMRGMNGLQARRESKAHPSWTLVTISCNPRE